MRSANCDSAFCRAYTTLTLRGIHWRSQPVVWFIATEYSESYANPDQRYRCAGGADACKRCTSRVHRISDISVLTELPNLFVVDLRDIAVLDKSSESDSMGVIWGVRRRRCSSEILAVSGTLRTPASRRSAILGTQQQKTQQLHESARGCCL